MATRFDLPENQVGPVVLGRVERSDFTNLDGRAINVLYRLGGNRDEPVLTFGDFAINPQTGVLTYNGDGENFEGPVDFYDFNVFASGIVEITIFDRRPANDMRDIRVTITDVDETPNVAPVLDDIPPATLTDTEARGGLGDITGRTFSAMDENTGDTSFTFAVVGAGTTAESGFTHSKTGTYGTLVFNSGTGAYKYVPDNDAIDRLAEGATESDEFSVTATDGRGATSAAKTLTINVHGVNDAPTLLNINARTLKDTEAYDTHDAITGTFTITDLDSSSYIFTVPGAVEDTSESGHTHRVDGTYGKLFFNNGNGDYRYVPNNVAINALGAGDRVSDTFSVTVTDDRNADSPPLTLTFNVEGADDAPRFTTDPITYTVDENVAVSRPIIIGTARAVDPEGDSVDYFIPDTRLVFINRGTIFYRGPFDHEATPTFTATIQALSGIQPNGRTTLQTLTINVRDVNEAPVFATGSYAFELAENMAGTPNAITIVDLEATDEDAGDSVTYSFQTTTTGFAIDANTGIITYTGAGFNYEALSAAQRTITFTVIATDDDATPLTDTQEITITITDADEKPTAMVLSESMASVDEGTTTARKLADITFTDDALGTNTATVSDTTRFEIRDTATANRLVKELWLKAGVTLDHGTDTSHEVTITSTASGTGNQPATQTFTLNVGNVNEAPVLADITGATLADTSAANTFTDITGTFSATDGDNNPITYAVTDAVADTSETDFTHSKAGTYGTLFYNSGTGAYKYVANAAAINALDAGASESDTFSVTANDGTVNSAAKTLTISVTGANEAPVFNTLPQDLAIPENHQTGSPTAFNVGSPVTATDADGTVSYTLSGAPTGWAIDSTSGQITYTGAPFDYEDLTEAQRTITFTVIATDDDGATTEQEVSITITDVNEAPNTPPVLEDIDAGSLTDTFLADDFDDIEGTFTATDEDAGNTSFTFAVADAVADTAETGFTHRVDGDYGKLYYNNGNGNYKYVPDNTAINALDAGDSESDTFSVTANDGTDDSAAKTLTINIQGENDDPLVFTTATIPVMHGQTYTFNINTFGTFIGYRDAEGHSFSRFTLTDITELYDPTGGHFEYQPPQNPQYHLVSAENVGTRRDPGILRNPNTWTIHKLRFVADEGANPAQDVTFGISVQDLEGGFSRDVQVTLDIINTGYVAPATNDAPVFGAASYTFEIADNDNSHRFGTVTATDPEGRTITYRLADGAPAGFVIGSSSGEITYGGSRLNHQTDPTITITVIASDGTVETEQDVTIMVTNANPVFDTIPALTLAENEDGSTTPINVGPEIRATDPEGRAITYSLKAGAPAGFAIDSRSGQITYAGSAADNDDGDSFSLTVVARDGVGGETEQAITINVGAADNNPPAFPALPEGQFARQLTLQEYAAGDENPVEIGTITATDADADSTIRYSFLQFTHELLAYNDLRINAETGLITYVGSGETSPETDSDATPYVLYGTFHTVYVRARSGNKVVDEPIQVRVVDIDDPPELADFYFAISPLTEETSGADTAIRLRDIRVIDGDAPDDTISWSLEDGSVSADDFRIEEDSSNEKLAVITYVGTGIDAENTNYAMRVNNAGETVTSTYVTINVKVTSGSLEATTELRVTITDVDEHPTAFEETSYTMSFDENADGQSRLNGAANPGILAGTIGSGDADRTQPHYYFYNTDNEIIQNDPVFRIDSITGQVFYIGAGADYEAGPRSYTRTVGARHGTTSGPPAATTTLTINVNDVDEAPEFDAPSYTFGFDENQASGTVGSVTATDPDAGETPTYSVSGHAGFSIDASTGEITYSGPVFDYEGLDAILRVIRLTVTASDTQGDTDGQFSVTQLVIVNIDDVNEPPEFGVIPTLSIDENSDGSTNPVMVQGGRITAEDPENDPITFTLANTDDAANFAIDETSGVISYTGPATGLDHETKNAFQLTVIASTGSGANIQTAERAVTINVNDINDAPVFGAPPDDLTIVENADGTGEGNAIPIGSPVTTTDEDDDTISYSLDGDPAGFTIDDNGQISYTGTGLDHETNNGEMELTVIADDGNGGTARQTVTITITDQPPVFDTPLPTLSIAENARGNIGSPVTAEDPEDDTAEVTYRLKTGAPAGFRIDGSSGQISYAGSALDHETEPTIELTIIATAGEVSTEQLVTITVTDVDEAPVFNAVPQDLEIAENVGSDDIGSPVTAYDPENPDDASAVTYSLKAGAPAGFTINSGTGQISYAGDGLNHEATATIELTVIATDGSDNPSEQIVTIRVTNEVERPVFTSAANFNFVENQDGSGAGEAKSVGRVTATDPENGTIVFSLADGRTGIAGDFAIDGSTGEITYTGTGLDHEDAAERSVTLEVTATAGTRTMTQTVTITVTNAPPVFDPISLSFAENQDGTLGGGVEIGTVTARDPDEADDRGTITYSVERQLGSGVRGPTNLYSIDSEGVVRYTGTARNFEDIQGFQLQIIIIATLGSGASRVTAEERVTVSLTDVNDAPVFTQTSYTFSSAENQDGRTNPVPIGTVSATDQDGDGITYSLQGDHTGFAINGSTGAITYTGAGLDHEATDEITLTVRATDDDTDDPRSTEREVTITVTDEPEDPVFEEDSYAFDFTENQDGSGDGNAIAVGSPVTATDEDEGNTIAYSLVNAPTGFAIDSTSGQISYTGTGADLDHEAAQNTITLTVRATDSTGRTVDQPVTITITNQPPIFNAIPTLTLAEDQDGSGDTAIPIGTVTARDPEDADAAVAYTFADGRTGTALNFAIDSSSGAITYTGAALDLEELSESTIDLTIIATIGSDDSQVSTEQVVTITIINDAPVFGATSYSFDLPENIAGTGREFLSGDDIPPYMIGTVTATDSEDPSATITYSLRGHADFRIDANGQITYVGTALDHDTLAESDRTITLIVTANNGLARAERQVTVTITNENEAPIFNPYSLSIDENQPASAENPLSLGRVTATDPDGDTVTYELLFDPPSFIIDENTGEISYTGSGLDRESRQSGHTYSITVRATANGQSTDELVRISVIDDPEPPIFNTIPTDLEIDENDDGSGQDAAINIGSPVTARDPEGQTVTYRLASGTPDYFTIDTDSGQISYTGTGLDHEEAETIAISVGAIDSGGLDTYQTVIITVNDIDEKPEFDEDSYAFDFAENQDGSGEGNAKPVGSVTATDPDDGDTAVIYSFQGTHTDFAIDADSGDISYTGTGFDYEAPPATDEARTITLTVRATDASDPTLYSELTITIHVTNQPPEFDAVPALTIVENEAGDDGSAVTIGSVTASDPEPEPHAETVSYDLKGNPDNFDIDANGEITYTGPALDYETTQTISLIVVASIEGSANVEQPITITVLNDPPVFDTPPTDFAIAENQAGTGEDGDGNTIPAQIIGTVTANDPESTATVSYRLKDNPADFAIDANGQITYIGTGLDAEAATEVTLTIIASIPGSVDVEQEVTISVTGVDEAPVFTQETYAFNSDENQDGRGEGNAINVGDPVTATDPEDDDVTYTLAARTGAAADFAIDEDSGQITYTGAGLNHENEDEDEITLTVIATANGLTTEQIVTITIDDVAEAPDFPDTLPALTIPENRDGSGTDAAINVGDPVTATDPEGDDITYTLATRTGVALDFEIDANSGQISYTGTGLDRTTDPTVTLTIIATDDSDDTLANQQQVTIRVTDQPPVFDTLPTDLEITENDDRTDRPLNLGSPVTATDPANQPITYSLKNAPAGFDIDNDGQITYSGTSLDREAVNGVIELTVVASDGALTTEATVRVSIGDVDEPPEFDPFPTDFEIAENTPGSTTPIRFRPDLLARDPETGETRLTYDLQGTTYGFEIREHAFGRILYTGNGLDHETNPTITLTLTARLGLGPMASIGTQELTITVTDVNEVPEFDEESYNLEIVENNAGNDGTALIVGSVTASDQDAGDIVTYNFKGAHDNFEIDANGQITYTGPAFDYEALTEDQRTITLTVVATDNDETPLSAEQTVTISIVDINEIPVLADITAGSYADTSAPDSFADITGRFTATDGDSDPIIFAVEGAVEDMSEEPFTHRVDGDYGTLYYNSGTGAYRYVPNNAAIDALADGASEADRFAVRANDGEADSAVKTLTISLTGANDTPIVSPTATIPVIHGQTYTFTADSFGTFIGYRDAEGKSFSRFSLPDRTELYNPTGGHFEHLVESSGQYQLFSEDNLPNFGTLGNIHKLRFVADADANPNQDVTFRIIVQDLDGAMSAEIQVTLDIINTPPAFDPATLPTDLTIAENEDGSGDGNAINVGSPVTASDPDSTISYRLKDDPDNFEIDASSGQISYTGPAFDYETLTEAERSITLTVIASDGQGETKQEVRIALISVDEAPVFMQETYGFNFDENQDGRGEGNAVNVGSPVRATDPENNAIAYSLATGRTGAAADFAIDEDSGQITYIGAGLNHENADEDEITLTVIATANGLMTEQTVIITIDDVVEAPEFMTPLPTLTIAENQDGSGDGRGINIGNPVRATDPEGDFVSYSLAAGAPADFMIDVETGQIRYTGSAFDYEALTEAERSITLTVIATDDSTGRLAAEQEITITVTNVNEAPVLADIAPQTIIETSTFGTFTDSAGTFTATDVDSQTITFAVTGAVADTTETGFTHRVDNTYGALFYNSGTGAYKYVPNNAAINAVAGNADLADTFSVTANDGTDDSAAKTLTVNIAPLPFAYANTAFSFTLPAPQNPVTYTVTIEDDFGMDRTANGWLSFDAATRTLSGTPGLNDIDEGLDVTITTSAGTVFNYYILVNEEPVAPTFSGAITAELPENRVYSEDETLGFLVDFEDYIDDSNSNESFTIAFNTGDAADNTDYAAIQALFSIEEGRLYYNGPARDYEANAESWTFKIVVTDRDGLQAKTSVTIRLTDANEAPVIANNALAYNQGQQAIVLGATDLSSTDEDAADGAADLTYTITGTLPSAGKLQLLGDHDSDANTAETWADITATFNSFTQSQINAGKLRYVPNDPQATDGASFTFTVADGGENGVGAVSGTLNVAVRETYTVTNPNRDNIIDLSTETTPKIVDAGDGLDTVTTGQGNDQIIGGLGSDLIHLAGGAGQSGGADELVYTFSGGDVWSAKDGGDLITGFKRGEDKIVFRVNAAETSARNLNAFLLATRGADEQALTLDDQIVVAPLFVYENNAFTVTGITFYFRNGGTYSDNKLAMGALDIEFDTAISWAEFMALVAKEGDANIDYGSLVIKDITVLPNLLGEGSLEFRLFLISTDDYTEFAMSTGTAADTLDASSQTEAQLIQGGDLADTITASAHGDVIAGGYGNDTIQLGAGNDIIVYRFNSQSDGSWRADDGGDTINGFTRGQDRLILVDTNTANGLTDEVQFFAAAKGASGVADDQFDVQLIFNADNSMLTGIDLVLKAAYDDNGPQNAGSATGTSLQIRFTTALSVTKDSNDIVTDIAGIDEGALEVRSNNYFLADIGKLTTLLGETENFDAFDTLAQTALGFDII